MSTLCEQRSIRFGLVLLSLSVPLWNAEALPAAWETIVFHDEFDYEGLPDESKWVTNHAGETWDMKKGRSVFPNPNLHPDGPFPSVGGGMLTIKHYDFNPYDDKSPKTTFLSGDVYSKGDGGTLSPDRNYRVEARVRGGYYPGGLVTSFFLYGFDGAVGDEIDFEFVSTMTNDAVNHANDAVLTNPWNDSPPLGWKNQKPRYVAPTGLDLNDWQTFRIYWYPEQHRAEWTWLPHLEDPYSEVWLRTETDAFYVPDQQMNVYFDFWACDDGWMDAYERNLQPDQVDHRDSYTYDIDYVRVATMPIGGDYNDNGIVDAADYTVWRDTLAAGGSLPNDETPGTVDEFDYEVWKVNFGTTFGAGAGAAVGPVSEPTSGLLLLISAMWLLSCCRCAACRHPSVNSIERVKNARHCQSLVAQSQERPHVP